MQDITFDELPTIVGQILETVRSISDRLCMIPTVKPLQKDSEYLTVHEVAALINRKVQTIYGMTHRRQIPHFRRGKMLMFRKSEIETWIESTRRATNEEIGSNAVQSAGQAMKKKGGSI